MQGYVYILTNYTNTVIYTGSTSNLKQRIYQHREKLIPGFTAKYNVTKLVYYEVCKSIITASEREIQIKAGSREKKRQLIQSMNPIWEDLFESIL